MRRRAPKRAAPLIELRTMAQAGGVVSALENSDSTQLTIQAARSVLCQLRASEIFAGYTPPLILLHYSNAAIPLAGRIAHPDRGALNNARCLRGIT